VSITVHEYFNRARRHYMWRNSDNNGKNKPLVAWKKCTKPKRKAGLGVIDLRAQNRALLIKHLDKFYNKADIPWVTLFGTSIILMGKSPMHQRIRGPSGGEMC
jgi:hypothetical protein